MLEKNSLARLNYMPSHCCRCICVKINCYFVRSPRAAKRLVAAAANFLLVLECQSSRRKGKSLASNRIGGFLSSLVRLGSRDVIDDCLPAKPAPPLGQQRTCCCAHSGCASNRSPRGNSNCCCCCRGGRFIVLWRAPRRIPLQTLRLNLSNSRELECASASVSPCRVS